ncbi:MAG: Flp pilus assembly complex ATPase component TadA [Deltaproteobacteria bacterium]|nr:Flp pilus assembly complex ATPase component TadA [Deltaproteobacteria bacterium]
MGTTNESGDAALLRFLVQNKLCAPELAQTANQELLNEKRADLIAWLVRKNVIDEEALARALSERLQIPYVNLASLVLDTAVSTLLKEDVATRFGTVPLRASDASLVVAMANPLDREAVRAVEFAAGRRLHVEVATRTIVQDTLAHMYHLDQALDEYLRGIPEGKDLPVTELVNESCDIKSLMRKSALPPVVKLLNLILVEAIQGGASDVHIETADASVLVRYRIDGILEETFRLPKWVQAPLIARCKVLAKLDITERRVPQDGRIRINYRESIIDLRMSSLPTQFGEKITLRILDSSRAPKGLDNFGFSAHDLQCIRHAIHRPEGMILVTGPTGSGKSTTLYGMLAEMISPERNIVTIENPIEYHLQGVNQVEVNLKQGLTFADTLRSILRQDPDVIMIGEIRDYETAEVALQAAQTGHLVLSTLHTNDAVSTITRLVDIGVEPYMLASSLHLILAQRLLRRTCEQCAAPYAPNPTQLRALQIETGAHRFQRGTGCPACHNTGLSGRSAAFEVLPITTAVAKIIEAKGSENALRAQGRTSGMRTLAEQAATMVSAGITTADEVLRVVDVLDPGSRCPSCGNAIDDNFVACPHCATPLQVKCQGCHARLEREWQICPYCGAAAGQQASVRSAPVAMPPAVGRRQAPAALPNTTAQQFRVLVVDDQQDMRRLAALTLERSGLPIAVSVAASGLEALESAVAEPPDAVVLDVMMPGMDGFEVCRQLRANLRTAFIPILMLTALDDPDNRAAGFLAGTDDYMGKPYARAELIARVGRILQRTYGASFGFETFRPEPAGQGLSAA